MMFGNIGYVKKNFYLLFSMFCFFYIKISKVDYSNIVIVFIVFLIEMY